MSKRKSRQGRKYTTPPIPGAYLHCGDDMFSASAIVLKEQNDTIKALAEGKDVKVNLDRPTISDVLTRCQFCEKLTKCNHPYTMLEECYTIDEKQIIDIATKGMHPDDWNDLQKKIDEAANENLGYKDKPKRINKDDYYLGIAKAVSKRSTCLKRHYGCVIVNNDEIIATGYNGSPRGEENCCDKGECKRLNIPNNSGDYSLCHSVHAEQNAMLSASRKDMLGATMYIAGEEEIPTGVDDEFKTIYMMCEIFDAKPCPICERMIRNSGIVKVINKEGKVLCL